MMRGRLLPAAVIAVLGGCPPAADERPSVPRLERAFRAGPPPGQALRLAEAIKCRRVSRALQRAGARPGRLDGPSGDSLHRLPEDAALLSLLQLDGRLHRLLYVRGRTVRRASLSVRRVEPLLIKARDELELGPLGDPRPLWRLLARAHRLLIADLEPELRGVRRLLVSGDGLWRYLPLHALVERVEPLRFAVQRRAFGYLPCLALLADAGTPSREALAVIPGYGVRAEPVAGAEVEVAALAARVRTRRVTGPMATPTALLRALRRPGQLVHFAGHGLAALEEPRDPSDLIFARGRALGVAELSRVPVRAPLVVLGSCGGGYVARFRDGQRLTGATNLAEALLAAGARAVVAAGWTVKGKQSARQLGGFYRRLRPLGPLAAMAAAQREQIDRLSPPHPRFWAGYAVHGTWR